MDFATVREDGGLKLSGVNENLPSRRNVGIAVGCDCLIMHRKKASTLLESRVNTALLVLLGALNYLAMQPAKWEQALTHCPPLTDLERRFGLSFYFSFHLKFLLIILKF